MCISHSRFGTRFSYFPWAISTESLLSRIDENNLTIKIEIEALKKEYLNLKTVEKLIFKNKYENTEQIGDNLWV